MASPASTETIEIRRRGRRRLIGAIAIVVLLVVFVPMLLDSEQRRSTNEPATQIPPRENAPPLPAPSKAPSAAPAATPPASPASSAPAPAGATKEPPTVASVAPREPPKSAPAATPAKASAPVLKGFAVQVGAFRDEEKLKEARAKLASASIAYYTERLEGDSKGLTRLRAGPFATREAAEDARASLKRVSLDGQVVPLP